MEIYIMPKTRTLLCPLLLLLFCCAAFSSAKGAPLTFTGSFLNDNTIVTTVLLNTTNTTYNFFTTSYGGGMNADGSSTLAGGFDPVLTLFSPAGTVVAFGGGTGTCSGTSKADTVTGLCEDANFTTTLGPGTYNLVLSEFPNVPLGSLSDGFLANGDGTFTGDNCGVAGGKFLQSDVAPCVQRTANYAVNISSVAPVPEPPTWLLVLPTVAAFVYFRRFAQPLA
jgi:hypothetical protein